MADIVYSDPLLPEYQGNPLIEALPPMGRSDEQLMDAMKRKPIFSVTERSLPGVVRREMVYRLCNLFIPLPIHLELFEELSIRLRRSYVWRNPLRPQVQAFLHHPGVSTVADSLSAERTASSHLLLVKGVSGIGKSCAIYSCLTALGPQLIQHMRYKDVAINETQVVWLKVGCPEDRSLKTLCAKILKSVDAVLGTHKYASQYCDDPRVTAGVLIDAVFQCLANEHVGVLAVDEMQNLFASKGQVALELLNFLLRLKDEAGVCLVLCGTYAALDVLSRKFRLSRRIAGSEIELTLPKSAADGEWTGFIEILWKYQWLPAPVAYSADCSQVLFDLTCGIRGVVVLLFIVAQIDAIKQKKQCLTTSDIRDTWNRRFGAIHDAMAALRSGKPADLGKWDDLCDSVTLQRLIDRTKRQTPVELCMAPEVDAAAGLGPAGCAPDGRSCKPAPTHREPQVGELGKLEAPGGIEALVAEGTIALPPE